MDFCYTDISKPIGSGLSAPGIVLSTLHELTHLLVIKTLGRYYYYLQFTYKIV